MKLTKYRERILDRIVAGQPVYQNTHTAALRKRGLIEFVERLPDGACRYRLTDEGRLHRGSMGPIETELRAAPMYPTRFSAESYDRLLWAWLDRVSLPTRDLVHWHASDFYFPLHHAVTEASEAARELRL